MKVNVKVTSNATQVFQDMKRELNHLPELAYKEFVKNTPIRKGNARRNTKLRNQKIEANYPYAAKLDEGYSDQSPKGMTEPTQQLIEQEFIKIMTGRK